MTARILHTWSNKTVGFCDDETAKEASLLEDIAEAGSEEAVEDDTAYDFWG